MSHNNQLTVISAAYTDLVARTGVIRYEDCIFDDAEPNNNKKSRNSDVTVPKRKYVALERVHYLCFNLYVGPSNYVTKNGSKSIGQYLLTDVTILASDVDHRLIQFLGKLFDFRTHSDPKAAYEAYAHRTNGGPATYCIKLCDGLYLDCQVAALAGRCRTSMANSPTHLTGV